MPAASTAAPDRGDTVWIDLDRQAGQAQAGRRPVLVLSPVRYNGKVGLAVCCPITTRVKGYPFEVPIPASLPVAGVVLADQVKSLDWRAHNASRICRLPDEVVADVLSKVRALL